MTAVTIRLGERAFTVRPLPLRVVRDISSASRAVMDFDPVEMEKQSWERMVSAISAALLRDHPEMTPDAILDCEGTIGDISAAYRMVLQLSGLVPSGEAEAPGQDPGATPSTGDGSTGA